jgi:hypothetical protein
MRWFRRRDSDSSTLENRTFWNTRYRTNPSLGSGIGSRGELAAQKRALVEDAWIASGEHSILDVGFGDLKVLDLSRFHDYIGIDVSDVAVDNARRRYPNHIFIRADFAGEADPEVPKANLVVCLDVLIHQLDAAAYRRMVRRLVEHGRRCGLVSGYDGPPPPDFASNITAFHEPLSQTLSHAGATTLTRVGEYRGLTAFRFLTD